MKKTCCYYGKVGHAEKTCWKKIYDLEEKVKYLEGVLAIVRSNGRSTNAFTFNVEPSQVLHAHMLKNEWVLDSNCTHHMVKDAFLFSSLNIVT